MSCDWLSAEEALRAERYLRERFGLPPGVLAGHRLLRRGEHVYAVRREACEACEALQWVSAGLRILKVSGRGFKPATPGMQVLGAGASDRVCDLGAAELAALVQGRSIPWTGEPGFVLVRHAGAVVGLGVARGGTLVSQLPRSVTENLRPTVAGSGSVP